ncbi:hypothetical protein Hanom_Chr01g00029411 [Helianthus anomalus]
MLRISSFYGKRTEFPLFLDDPDNQSVDIYFFFKIQQFSQQFNNIIKFHQCIYYIINFVKCAKDETKSLG